MSPDIHLETCHRLDRVGSVASITCAIHCALMPILLTVLPSTLGATIGSEWIEWGLFGSSAFIGLASMHRGRKVHRRSSALAICVIGLTILALGRISEALSFGLGAVVVVVIGGLVIALAHFVNMRLCRNCSILGGISAK